MSFGQSTNKPRKEDKKENRRRKTEERSNRKGTEQNEN